MTNPRRYVLRTARFRLLRDSSPSESSEDQQEHAGPDEGHEDDARQPAERAADAQCAKEPRADERADDTDHDVGDDPVATAYDQRGEDAGNQSHDDPGQQLHRGAPKGFAEGAG